MASGTTTIRKRPYPLETDSPDVAADMQALAASLDHTPTVGVGTLLNRPASQYPGDRYLVEGDPAAANNGIEWVDTGSGWIVANVSSVFGRTGPVVASTGDYTAAQVTNAADKSSTSTQVFAGGVTTGYHLFSTGSSYTGAYGVGTPTSANAEFIRMFHNGASDKAYIEVAQLGSGGYRNLSFRVGAAEALLLDTAQNATFRASLAVVNPATAGYTGNLGSVSVSQGDSTAYNAYVFTNSAGNRFFVDGSGVIHSMSASIVGISDRALKTNIRDLAGPLAAIRALKPRQFQWNDHDFNGHRQGQEDYGFIAQEVEEVLPHLVGAFEHGRDDRDESFKSLRMGDLIPFLVGAVQELTAKVEALEAQR